VREATDCSGEKRCVLDHHNNPQHMMHADNNHIRSDMQRLNGQQGFHRRHRRLKLPLTMPACARTRYVQSVPHRGLQMRLRLGSRRRCARVALQSHLPPAFAALPRPGYAISTLDGSAQGASYVSGHLELCPNGCNNGGAGMARVNNGSSGFVQSFRETDAFLTSAFPPQSATGPAPSLRVPVRPAAAAHW